MVGWYSTGPKIRSSDLEINERFRKYCKNPVLVIIDVQPKEFGIPTEAYMTIDEIKDVRPAFGWASFCNVRRTDPMACMGQDGTPSSRTFSHLPCSIGALEVSGCVNAGMSDSSVGRLRPAAADAQCASRSEHRRHACSRPPVLFACGTWPQMFGQAEEIGVEHLLRDVKDTTVSTLSNQVRLSLADACDRNGSE